MVTASHNPKEYNGYKVSCAACNVDAGGASFECQAGSLLSGAAAAEATLAAT